MHLGQLRLVVERLQVRRPAGHVQVDDALGARRDVQRMDDARPFVDRGAGRIGRGRARRCWVQQRRQRQRPQARAGAAQETLAATVAVTSVGESSLVPRAVDGSWLFEVAQIRVIVSCRFSSTRTTEVQAASSAAIDVLRAAASRRRSTSCSAAAGSAAYSARCLSSKRDQHVQLFGCRLARQRLAIGPAQPRVGRRRRLRPATRSAKTRAAST